MLTPRLVEELRQWMRPMSSLTAFAKSLNNVEGGGSQILDPSKTTQNPNDPNPQATVDHFEGIDLDELPDSVRERVEKARGEISSLQKSAVASEERRVQAEQFARRQQSEADKLRNVVQRHNLDPNASPHTPSNPADTKHAARVERLTKQGLKPEAAEVYAKMLGEESAAMEAEILGKLGPLAGSVGNIQANQALSEVESEKAAYFAIPEVAKAVRDNVDILIKQGSSVNKSTVEHLLTMGYGNHLMQGGKPAGAQAQIQVPNLGGGGGMGGGGGHVSQANQPTSNGAPVATQPETVSIINALNQHMKSGLVSQKGKK